MLKTTKPKGYQTAGQMLKMVKAYLPTISNGVGNAVPNAFMLNLGNSHEAS